MSARIEIKNINFYNTPAREARTFLNPPPIERKRMREDLYEEDDLSYEDEDSPKQTTDEEDDTLLEKATDLRLDETDEKVKPIKLPYGSPSRPCNLRTIIDKLDVHQIMAIKERGFILVMGDLHDSKIKTYFQKKQRALGIKKVKRNIQFADAPEDILDYLKTHQSR